LGDRVRSRRPPFDEQQGGAVVIVGSPDLQRGRALAVALVGLLVVALAAAVPTDRVPAGGTPVEAPIQVIVQKVWAADRGPELAVQRLGGRVLQALPIVGGFAATLRGAGRPLDDDRLPDFTGRGATAADGLPKPDVVAPGAHVISLRAPGSTVDTTYSTYVDGSYRRGERHLDGGRGGLWRGRVAAAGQPRRHPQPGEVRAHRDRQGGRLRRPAGGWRRGGGRLPSLVLDPPGEADQGLDHSTGMGSLGQSRGSVQTQADDPPATVLGWSWA
jgi:hypothetical protein